MKTRILLTIFVACLALWSTGKAAHAQDESLNRARDAFDQGQSFFQAGKFDEAALQFKNAYDARPYAQFLFNIGACYEKSDNYPSALAYYEKYLAAGPEQDDAKKTKLRIEALKEAIDEMKAAGTDPSTPSEAMKNLENVEIPGLVVIESDPQGADIYIDSRDSKPLSKTPWNGSLTGEHLIIIERKGYKPVEKTIRADPNRLFYWVSSLAEEDYLGYLDVTSNIPGADIYIDDRSVGVQGKTPWRDEIKPGKHKVWVTREGYDVFETEVEVIAGETHKISANIVGDEVGYLNVRGTGMDKYKIVVDGKVLCKRAPCLKPLSPGKHRLSIRRPGYRSYNTKIDVQSKTEITVRTKLAPEPSRADAYVSFLFAAAFAGGGYYLGTKSQDVEDELAAEIEAGNPPPDSNDPRLGWGLESGKTYSTAASVSYGLGGASFVLAVYYLFRDKGKPSTGSSDHRAISLKTQVTPSYSGIGIAGSF
ncbi:MAG: PEGA domain-containing protein [Myxococcales bacterium]|nr:PEGA domain-containing protein [Myxococcales bacterium]